MTTTGGAETNGKTAVPPPHFRHLLFNILSSRQDFFRRFGDPRRDIDDECGYPRGIISPQLYQDAYERDAIARRAIEVMSKEAWKVHPKIYEVEDAEVKTPFELAWDELPRSLYGEENTYFQDEYGSLVWECLKRADILSGIGRYGVLFLALDDTKGDDLSQPAAPKQGRKVLFLRAFAETQALITQYETNLNSRRFGQPVMYAITFGDPRRQQGSAGRQASTHNVHWTRVIHISDSEVFHTPRMQTVYNRIYDLQKVYGADAEAYWKNALAKLIFDNPNGDTDLDLASLKNMMEDFGNGLQPWLALTGLNAKTLPPAVVDPTPHIGVQIDAICICLGIPRRIFMGSERGELASSQDESAWNDRLLEHQNSCLTPRQVVPFVNRLISLGVLPAPSGYSVWWPDMDAQTEDQKADVTLKKSQALVQCSTQTVLAPLDCLTQILGMEEEEALVFDANAEALREKAKKEAEKLALAATAAKGPTSSRGE